MGIYLNPGYTGFEEIRRDIYVDKTGLISFMNSLIGKPKPLVSFSRPRRFGKSFDANMICAYYDRSCDSRFLYEDLKISKDDSFEKHLNKYNVITFDVTGFIMDSRDNDTDIILNIRNSLLRELRDAFPGCIDDEEKNLGKALYAVVSKGNEKFVFVIDEWDALFREYKDDKRLQEDYILFLRNLFKNKDTTSRTIAAAYMTGILPIKKYGTESALTDFKEYSMTTPKRLAEYIGFTEDEVKRLCDEYRMDFDEMQSWYDGYSFSRMKHVYSPNSVMNAIQEEEIANYWTQTETFESLKKYIGMGFDGLKDAIIKMLGGERVSVRISTFQNDITSLKDKNDVLTLLIHLGYLAYDSEKRETYIPNFEVAEAFEDAVSGTEWGAVGKALSDSERLLEATLAKDAESVADALEQIHSSVSSVLNYNNEASLSCAITIAYYTAKRYYSIVRELPVGKGFADLAFLPRRGTDKPAMIIELKYARDADTAIQQIHENRYDGDLKEYFGNLLLVGINYDKDAKGANAKRHSCLIEKV
ncbi:MAG: ATP-binding protein [Clostridiales bacterium]|nr:ATP-binding protein [Clostridiales bacterium]